MSKTKKKESSAAGAKKKKITPSPSENEATGTTEVKPKKGGIIRAIRITQEILDAAKAYKKESGVSFYTLGYEAISERLVREGFLKVAETAKS